MVQSVPNKYFDNNKWKVSSIVEHSNTNLESLGSNSSRSNVKRIQMMNALTTYYLILTVCLLSCMKCVDRVQKCQALMDGKPGWRGAIRRFKLLQHCCSNASTILRFMWTLATWNIKFKILLVGMATNFLSRKNL